MITKRCKEARWIDENTRFYRFYVRASGGSREMLRQAQKKATQARGDAPSNPVFLDELLRAYVLGESVRDHTDKLHNAS